MTTYPRDTDLKCSECASPIVEDEWVETTADVVSGEPTERMGTALYCTNPDCPHKTIPLETL